MLTRRALFRRSAALGGLVVLGCKGGPPPICTDVSGLSPDDAKARSALGYLDSTPNAERSCDRCTQFIAAKSGCGSCRILPGPISPAGSCRVFASKG